MGSTVLSDITNSKALQNLISQLKLDEYAFTNKYHEIDFVSNLTSDYKLLEVPEDMVSHFCSPGCEQVLTFQDENKPNNSGRIFAYTKNKSFSLIDVETSNTLLVASYSDANSLNKSGIQIEAIKHNYYELQPVNAPSLYDLWNFILPYTYNGFVIDEEMNSNPICLDLLRNRFPCSDFDLHWAMNRLRLCEIDDKYYAMDPVYITQVIRDLFSYAEENSWDWSRTGFPVNESIACLQTNHNREVIKKILCLFFVATQTNNNCNNNNSNDNEIYMYPDNSKICQVIGEHLLSVVKSFDLLDFMSLWKASVPSGLSPKLRRDLTCAGRAFCQSDFYSTCHMFTKADTGTGAEEQPDKQFKTITLLRSEELPDQTVDMRISTLFERCSPWPEAELGSYIEELIPSVVDRSYLKDYKEFALDDGDTIKMVLSDSFTLAYTSAENDDEFELDNPKQLSPAVSALINKFCYVTSTSSGHICTLKRSSHK